jgi:uncharacterized protein
VPARADSFDLGALRLTSGEGRRLELQVRIEPLQFGGEAYTVAPADAVLDISRTTGDGHALRLRFEATLTGPCLRCMDAIERVQEVDAREVDQPGGGEELQSPYMDGHELDLAGWARDALVLALPPQLVAPLDADERCTVCRRTVAEVTGAAAPEEPAPSGPDPRWAKLSEIRFE